MVLGDAEAQFSLCKDVQDYREMEVKSLALATFARHVLVASWRKYADNFSHDG
jgi:hypothetical protein